MKRLRMSATAFSSYTLFIYVNILLRDYSIVGASFFPSDDKILTVNRDVVVPIGRTVYLTTDQLQIRVNASDRCEVKVVDNDPLSRRPGRLTPSVFLCNFAQQEVVYTHFGAENPKHDNIRLLIRYDSFSETTFIPFTIRIGVSKTPLEVVTRNLPLTVDKTLGVSSPINVNTTEFAYVRGREQCRVSLLPLTSGRPRHGVIMDDTAKLQMVDCVEFLNQNIRYKHVTQANSPNKDFIPLVVSVLDSTGKFLRSEHFQVMVRISGGKENEKPTLEFGSKLNMEVTQLLLTAIQPEILSAKDVETPSDLLLFNITKPIPTADGHFINTDNRHQKITSFYQRDVRDLKVVYVPPSVDPGVSKVLYIAMQVVDGDGALSEPFGVKISVRPLIPLGPKITNNKGLTIFEGKSVHLALDSNFKISDANNLDKVKISLVAGPRHGHLTIPDNRQFFSPSDLRSGFIAYQHDDSDSFSDNMIFRVTDGEYSSQFVFPVWVLPEDDEPPVLTVNTGLEISKNDRVKITPLILSATDSDSDNTQVRYVLETPYSEEGVILKRQVQTPDNPEDWKVVDGMYEQSVDEFTQSDVISGLMFYKHVGPHRSDIIIDRIRFHIADSGDPPNQSDVKEFLVKIEPVDDQPPYLFYNTSLQMDVVDYETTYFKRKALRYADDDSDDRDIKFHVTSPPADTDVNTRMDAGAITACKDTLKVLKTFTQGQVNHQEICYQPPEEDSGITPRIIQFVFDVEDANGNILKDQRFTLMVQPMTHSPPVIKNAGLNVVEGDSATLTLDDFDAVESYSSEDNIVFEVMDLPRHGQIKLRNDPMDKGDTFARKHIRDGHVVYTNNGETVGDDKIMIDVTDGVHHIPVKLNIKVRGLADERPPMVGGRSEILKVFLEVPEKGVVTLTADNLKGVDLGGSRATFLLERAPLDGVVAIREKQSTEFSQADILAGVISYRHTGGEVGLTGRGDHFQIAIINPKKALTLDGRTISKLLVEIKINPVDNQSPILTVGAPFEVPESKKAPILTRHVDAADVDSEDGDILCLVTLQPKTGYLENSSPAPGSEKSRTGAPISSFTIRDIRSGLINYVQSVHKGSEPRKDSLMFYCTDGINQSPHSSIDIRILPFNDEVPEITLREFLVVEGGNMRIDLQILNVLDQDVPADKLTFLITAPPRHGKIVRQTREGSFTIPSFSLEDITGESTIAYEHDDSETTVDSFTFTLTDGAHNISKTVPINVFPLDDVTPRLAVNTGLQIMAGEAKKITSKFLKADDLDSNDADLLYYVRLKPKYGYLRKIEGNTIKNLTQGDKFTQKDIDKRRIEYVHTDHEGVRDLIKFDITDGLNSLIDRFFYVTVEGVETATPKVYNKGLQLPEEGVVYLTLDLLSETDLNTAEGDLTFSVTRAPAQGQLEVANKSGVSLSAFTLQQLGTRGIRYVHNSEEELKMDSFEFEVTDGQTPVTSTFRISVSDSSNRKPILMFQTLRVKNGDNRLITSTELKAEDLDTDQVHVVFTVTEVPKRGVLLYNMTRVLSSFTMADIADNMLSYQHDGSQAKEDSFSFTVTDGSHHDFFVYPDTDTTHRPQTMIVNIVADDNGAPQININKRASYLTKLAGGHLGFRISSRVLSMEDREIPEDNLLYSLITSPNWGYVINRAIGNRSITTWSQGDINRQLIEYILKPGVNATSDSFYFTISDKGGNILVSQPFHLNWAWISMESDNYVVNETEPTLNVTIRRRGYLGEIAFVTVTVVGRSAKSGEDFASRYAKQIQFSPGQTEKTWRLKIQDDHQYEDLETFEIKLSDPVSAVLEHPEAAQVTIKDSEDESQIFFTDREFRVAEDYGEILLPIKRIGDFTGETSAICSTVQGSASGTFPTSMTSSDYVPRPLDHTSVVKFDRGKQESYCRVVIIDDNLFEDEEKFTVLLSDPVGGKLGKISSIQIIIEPDMNDVPVFYHGSPEYTVDESDGFVELQIWRGGSDLSKVSSVMVRSRKSDPKSADAGQDYIAINNVLEFGPGETVQSVRVVIIDDVGKPRLEGPESFLVQLRGPVNGVLGEPQSSMVIINDAVSDLPSMQFKEGTYNVRENDLEVRAIIIRSGDINHESTVQCSTRQGTAKPGEDYIERLETDDSVIVFNSGDYAKECVVKLIDNFLFEDVKHFRLVLTSPQSASLKAAKIGQQNSTTVTIGDEDDYPLIKLSDTRYLVKEPMFKEEKSYLKIPVLREGDLSQTAIVSINTKDGSAAAGADYSGFFKELVFGTNVSKLEVEVEIFYDGQKEAREMFTVHLSSRSGIVKIENSKANVFIEERNKVADVTFPDLPVVMSLRDYDRPESADQKPIQGYPLVCVTPCNPKHPNYENSRPQCDGQGIDDTLTLFRWRGTTLTQTGAVSTDVQDIEFSTFFTSTKSITLDSVYFAGGSKVQCGARAVNQEGDPGLEQLSDLKTIHPESGICEPRSMDSINAEPFRAKIKYTSHNNPKHPKKVKMTITIPHRDGMLPVFSPQPIIDFDEALSKDGVKLTSQMCSNLQDFKEAPTEYGFLSNNTQHRMIVGDTLPYQHSVRMRSEQTLKFYKNVDLKSCLWTFESYFDMSDLITQCGGEIKVDGQGVNTKQSYLSLNIPLHLSYVFHSPINDKNWIHFDVSSKLQLSFVYDTPVVWEKGISSRDDANGLQGSLYPLSIVYREDGRLVVSFLTEARFNGQFIMSHVDSTFKSVVSSPDHPDVIFYLELVQHEQSGQEWSFISELTGLRDFSGTYMVQLIPCIVSLDAKFNQPNGCSPQTPLTFELPIRIRQVSDPVPAKYSLNTNFYLTRRRDLWLSDNDLGIKDALNDAFSPFDKIYGRINVDPVQNLGHSYDLSIDKLFLCSGKDGHIPKYDPDNGEYGCLAKSPNLQYNFKILDKGSSTGVDTKFGDVPFKATPASEDSGALKLFRRVGADGFSLDCQAVYLVDPGRQWFLQAIFTVRSLRNSGRGTWKRSTPGTDMLHMMDTHRQKREGDDTLGVGMDGKGTNLIRIQLDYLNSNGLDAQLDASISSDTEIPLMPIIIAVVALIFIICIIIVVLFIRQKRKSSSPPPSPTSTITIIKNGHGKVMTTSQHYKGTSEV